jgi:hypothetical protein
MTSSQDTQLRGLFTQVRGETVWKFGTRSESGLSRAARRGEEESICLLLLPKTRVEEPSGHFPNSFTRVIRRSSRVALRGSVGLRKGAGVPATHPGRGSSKPEELSTGPPPKRDQPPERGHPPITTPMASGTAPLLDLAPQCNLTLAKHRGRVGLVHRSDASLRSS